MSTKDTSTDQNIQKSNTVTNTGQNEDTEQTSQLENSMKDLLERILTYLEKFIKTKEDLQAVEEKLNDYDNLDSLLVIIKTIFEHLTVKVDETIKNGQKIDNNDDNNNSKIEGTDSGKQSEYEALEKIVQKHEQEIRTHIRLEQQLKLYAESLQSKLDESEKTRQELLQSTKNMINEIKRDNQVLNEQMIQIKNQNSQQQQKIKNLEQEIQQNLEKVKNYDTMQEKVNQLEKLVGDQSLISKPLTYRPMSEQSNSQPQQVHHHQSAQGSYKKPSIENDYSNIKKAQTPILGMKSGKQSPTKDRRGTASNIDSNHINKSLGNNNQSNNDYLKVKIEIGQKPKKQDTQFRNSYQRFYNQVKQARDENVRGNSGKEINQIYSAQLSQNQTKQHSKDREYRTIQNSYNGSHNGSFNNGKPVTKSFNNQQQIQQQNINNYLHSNNQQGAQLHNYQKQVQNYLNSQQQQQQQHKRSKSHSQHNQYNQQNQGNNTQNNNQNNSNNNNQNQNQSNKVRGGSNNNNQKKNAVTDYSRFSNGDVNNENQTVNTHQSSKSNNFNLNNNVSQTNNTQNTQISSNHQHSQSMGYNQYISNINNSNYNQSQQYQKYQRSQQQQFQ